MKGSLVLLVTFSTFCCNGLSTDKSLQQIVLSAIIEEVAIPLPPPPPARGSFNNQTLSQKKIDSIKSIKLNVGLYPLSIKYEYPISIGENYPSDFFPLIKEIPFQDSRELPRIDMEKFSRHNVELVTWDGKSEMGNFDVLIKISNVIWSQDKTRAAAIAIRKLGKKDGTTYLFLFKKISPRDEIIIYRKYVLKKA
jgi:hypothetical protein